MATLSTALRAGKRLKAWKTTPTPWRRYSSRALPVSAVTSVSSSTIDPRAGVSNVASVESSVVLPHPLAPTRSDELAVTDLQVEPVDRAHDVAAPLVFERQVRERQRGHF